MKVEFKNAFYSGSFGKFSAGICDVPDELVDKLPSDALVLDGPAKKRGRPAKGASDGGSDGGSDVSDDDGPAAQSEE